MLLLKTGPALLILSHFPLVILNVVVLQAASANWKILHILTLRNGLRTISYS